METVKYSIYNPSGNITALVNGNYPEDQRRPINDVILKNNPQIEQVGFAFYERETPTLQMAGGEFCVNASRACAFYFLNGEEGEIKLKASGVSTKLKVGQRSNTTYCRVPIKASQINDVIKGIVRLEGITQLIVSSRSILDPDNAKSKASNIVSGYLAQNIDRNNAIGVMFLSKRSEDYSIQPVVNVLTINTQYYEQACGSGTVAVALYLNAVNRDLKKEIGVRQPSGEVIYAQIGYDEAGLPKEVTISGNLSIIDKEAKLVIDLDNV